MNRRTIAALLATKAAGVAAVALVNRSLRLDDLPPTLPGRAQDWSWRGWRVRYTVLGEGPPVVLLHGIHAAASSFEMRQVFEPLAGRFTVYAVDLLGFGKSERPAIHYDGELYAALVQDFLDAVVRAPTAIVASSLSTAYAVSSAAGRPETVERLVLVCPTGEAGISGPGLGSELAYRLLRSPIQGEALFNALVSRWSIRRFLVERVFADPTRVTDALVDQHWATAHQPNARYAPAAFLGGRLNLPLPARLAQVMQPTLLVWGREARLTPLDEATPLRRANPRAELRVIEDAGLLPHDEQADRFLEVVVPFLEGAE
ncbi:MAG: alpha/beta fold hydrolase [Chloroflexota bacterium]|nr:alpha/beta fold hydrolase [Chloroflexota bacterium]